ncbi:N-acetylmuramoyl-L-alanine amidase [Cyanobium sp. Morenito 9A2]|uniref:N-acetylmuramoyl-L-alanine amidase n=1 Tax=Cyanobium sp. Morenito 9A2 TaxID=2823718 RepID=UPI0020CCAB01|nr:peptidoglycan recognition family protein [Cyanobium sp. Morenito 9A2]MCP9850087.1 N-acetylmuramoyl-L-alanine amidase [Cyanobium sp. Morenito 9A2]
MLRPPERKSFQRWRQERPALLVGLGLGGLGCLLGLIWLGRTIGESTTSRGDPTLMSFLRDGVQGTSKAGDLFRRAPGPPPAEPWRSPLRRQCLSSDPALKQRLKRLGAVLQQRTVQLPTDPTNFGERFNQDAFGQPLDPTPRVIVLHETVYGLTSAINTFITPHPRDEDQVSYHTLVGLQGEVVQVLDPVRRAFGAGNSAFNGQWVVTNPKLNGSVNNFALHLSLETPLDGENDGPEHSGYTEAQLDATAVVLADWMKRFPIPPQSITTHRAVDLGGERQDPRSFDWSGLQERLAALGSLC